MLQVICAPSKRLAIYIKIGIVHRLKSVPVMRTWNWAINTVKHVCTAYRNMAHQCAMTNDLISRLKRRLNQRKHARRSTGFTFESVEGPQKPSPHMAQSRARERCIQQMWNCKFIHALPWLYWPYSYSYSVLGHLQSTWAAFCFVLFD